MKNKTMKLLVISCSVCISSVGLSSFVIGDIINNKYVADNDIGSEPVAYIIGRDERFTSIEKALDFAQRDDIVCLIPPTKANYHPTNNKVLPDQVTYEIKSNCEIKEGVTLVIPTDSASLETVHDKSSLNEYIKSMQEDDRSRGEVITKKDENENLVEDPSASKASYGKYAVSDEAHYLRVTVKIRDNVVLKNNGNLVVSGYLSSGASAGAGVRGQTSHSYSQIILGRSAKIVQEKANAVTHCYGYIKEESKGNNSYVNIIDGKVYIPFIVNDYRGFAFTSGIEDAVKNEHCTPFNQIEFQNIQANCYFRFGSEVYGVCNLFLYQDAGLIVVNEVFHTTFKLIGNASDSLITFTDERNSFILSYFDQSYDVLNLNCFGGFKLNNLDFAIKVSGVNIKLSTSDAYFPISYRMKLTLSKSDNQDTNAIFDTTNQMIKLLPGSSLKVNDGVELLGKELIVYSAFIDGSNGQRDDVRWSAGTIYPVKEPALCEVSDNGFLKMDKVAGNIFCSKPGNINYINSDIIGSKEPWNQKQSGLQYVTKDYLDIREKLEIIPLENKSKKKIIIAQNTFYNPTDYPSPYLPSVSVIFNDKQYDFDGIQGVIYIDDNIKNAKLIFNNNISTVKKGIGNSLNNYSFSRYQYEEEITSNYNLIFSTVNSKNEIIRNENINEFLPQAISIRSLTPKVDGKDPLYVGKNIYLTADLVDENKIYDKTILRSSSDSNIAKVDSSGVVTGIATGKVTIFAQCGNKKAEYQTEVLEDSEIVAIDSAWISDDTGIYTSNTIAGSKALDKVTGGTGLGITFPNNLYEYNYYTKAHDGETKFTLNYLPDNAAISKVTWRFKSSSKQKLLDYDGSELTDGTLLEDDGSLSCTIRWAGYTNTSPDACALFCEITDLSGNVINLHLVILHDSGTNICIVDGTKIRVGFTEEKLVENLKIQDKLLSFNHFEGRFELKDLFYNYHANENNCVTDVFLTLIFEKNVSITIYQEHGFYDKTLNKYVYINRRNCTEFINHDFAYVDTNSISSVKLISANLKKETRRVYSPVSKVNLNVVTNGLLSITGEIYGWFNFFVYDANFKYIKEDIDKSIEKYGLYDREYFDGRINAGLYDILPLKYLKISVGKDLINESNITYVLNKYLKDK